MDGCTRKCHVKPTPLYKDIILLVLISTTEIFPVLQGLGLIWHLMILLPLLILLLLLKCSLLLLKCSLLLLKCILMPLLILLLLMSILLLRRLLVLVGGMLLRLLLLLQRLGVGRRLRWQRWWLEDGRWWHELLLLRLSGLSVVRRQLRVLDVDLAP